MLGVVALFLLDEPQPTGTEGPDADALARRIMTAVDVDAWSRVAWIQWDFGGRRKHIWDRERGLVKVTRGDVDVWLRVSNRTGVAKRAGVRLEGDAAKAALNEAWQMWINDSFWLNPFPKLFDSGVRRRITDSGALIVEFSSGGVTPGDVYLIEVDPDGRPRSWKMWVSIIPLGGLEASWDDWDQLESGAYVSQHHDIAFLDLELTDVRSGPSLMKAFQSDPFAPLVP